MLARLVIQLPYTIDGARNPAFDDGITVRDCHGTHQYVYYAGAGKQVGYPRGTFSDSGRGAVENQQGDFLHRYEHVTASGTINHSRGSITYTIAGCSTRHYALRAKG